MKNTQLKPCPFCGFNFSKDLVDILYPSGIYWRENSEIGGEYIGFKDMLPTDHTCWKIVCNGTMGGCGAEIHGDSKEEVIEKWNTRI